MERVRRLLIIFNILACLLQTHGADKYTDENRPYEFGFTIDGEQHRHEKKDENGIIMGEFGFITADGVYHVTVYATDENGNFKILSMKNIRVKPYPTAPTRQGHSLPLPPAEKPSVPQSQPQSAAPVPSPSTAPPQPQTPKPVSIEPPAKSCSHCSLPTTPKPQPPVPASVSNIPSQGNAPFGSSPQYPQQNGQITYPGQNIPQNQQNGFQPPEGTPQFDSRFGEGSPNGGQNIPQQGEGNYPQGPGSSQNYPQGPTSAQNYPQEQGGAQYPGQDSQKQSERNPKQYEGAPPPFGSTSPQQYSPQAAGGDNFTPAQGGQSVPTKPTLISAQMQIVDKNTDIHHRGPGENEGLPNGLTEKDMHVLLYIFNYTVGFHGHYEEGYTDGTKQGYYYVTGRNGVKTRVDYVADKNGFRPKITQEILDIISDEVPKPETEKDPKYGLKGYEFKWLYYPVETKAR